MEIRILNEYEPFILEQINVLLPQLDSSIELLNEDDLKALIVSSNSHLLIAFEDDQILGILTLAWYNKPTGIKAWIEDVVVSESARGKGVGKLLTEEAINLAKQEGAKSVYLTSRPSREAANRLYKRIGFVQYETNVYKYVI